MQYWPNDVLYGDVMSPLEILKSAAIELEQNNSRVRAEVESARVNDRIVLGFLIHHRIANKTLRLFEAMRRPDAAYPARLVPPDSNELPEYLQKMRCVEEPYEIASGLRTAMERFGGSRGKWVEEPWVCNTPGEFDEKLRELLSLPYIVALLISFLATPDNLGHSEANDDPAAEAGDGPDAEAGEGPDAEFEGSQE